ncbi:MULTISPECIES: arsenate reductase/protein-tyrosine-phosphatase family protein [Micrococcus]|uniref:arsenate reductase/protein-tyrosine-phosphatase family protein n=1 Tax=Micrococcus antarcticus TaxID=86171 RepID=UPI0038501AEC
MPLPPFRLTRPGPAPAPRRSARHSAGAAPGAVLLVCTGNICRSAYGAHALQAELDARVPGRVEVASLGTAPDRALTVPPPLLEIAEQRGVPGLAEHRPAPLVAPAVQHADLVLVASQRHRPAVLQDAPRAAHRTFTVLEFAAILRAIRKRAQAGAEVSEDIAGIELPDLVARAGRERARVRAGAGALDIRDPYGLPDSAYAEMADVMDPAIEEIARALTRALSPSEG